MVDDKETKQRFRADHLYGLIAHVDGSDTPFTTVTPPNDLVAAKLSADQELIATLNVGSVGEAVDTLRLAPKKIPLTDKIKRALKAVELVKLSAGHAKVISGFR
jgi:hypothetical protein